MRDFAFYYPGPVWSSSDQIKNLILFFDGIALLVPEYLREKPFLSDPALATGLAGSGLLEILEPEKIIDAEAAQALAKTLAQLIQSGRLETLARRDTEFHELSYSRLGSFGDERVAAELLNQLKRRGWARDSVDGVSIPMHPVVRAVILILWSQLLRPAGRTRGLELWPATDRAELVAGLRELLNVPDLPSAGHVVASDLVDVGVDLAAVPIDEVLGFKRQYGEHFRTYARKLREFLHELAPLSAEERQLALRDRSEEIRAAAESLATTSRNAWKRPARLAVGIAGAAWTAASGNAPAAAISLAALLLGSDKPPRTVDAFSYLFAAREHLI